MSSKSLILGKEGVAHMVLVWMHEDTIPKQAAKLYKFATPELRESFIESLTLAQAMMLALRRFMEK